MNPRRFCLPTRCSAFYSRSWLNCVTALFRRVKHFIICATPPGSVLGDKVPGHPPCPHAAGMMDHHNGRSGCARRSLTCVERPRRQDRQGGPVGRNSTYGGSAGIMPAFGNESSPPQRVYTCEGLKVSLPRGDAEVDFRALLRALSASAGKQNVTSQAKKVYIEYPVRNSSASGLAGGDSPKPRRGPMT